MIILIVGALLGSGCQANAVVGELAASPPADASIDQSGEDDYEIDPNRFQGRRDRWTMPSMSMEPTLTFESSFWTSPDIDWSVGAVVTFDGPEGTAGAGFVLVKRIVAGPGSLVELIDAQVVVDGVVLDEPYILEDRTTFPRATAIPGCEGEPSSDRCQLGADVVFVMGDNRQMSADSRTFGPIPIDSIRGTLVDQ